MIPCWLYWLLTMQYGVMDNPRIIVLGSLNMGLTSYVHHHPAPGETLISKSYTICGGKGANQAVACAKLSRSYDHAHAPSDSLLEVAMVDVVGDDQHGSQLLSHLPTYGVDTFMVSKARGTSTCTATIIVDEATGQNRTVLSPGANNITEVIKENVSQVLDGSYERPYLLVLQLEIPITVVLEAI